MKNFKKHYYDGEGNFETPNEKLYKEAILIAEYIVEVIKLPLGWSDYEESYSVDDHLYNLDSQIELFERVRDIILPEAVCSSPYYGGSEDDKILDSVNALSYSDYVLMNTSSKKL